MWYILILSENCYFNWKNENFILILSIPLSVSIIPWVLYMIQSFYSVIISYLKFLLHCHITSVQSVQFSRSVVSDCDPMNRTAHQASLSITNSRSSPRLTSIESVMPSSHLILCRPLLLHPNPSYLPSIRVFSSESTLRMRWPKYWSFSFSIIPSKEIPGHIT